MRVQGWDLVDVAVSDVTAEGELRPRWEALWWHRMRVIVPPLCLPPWRREMWGRLNHHADMLIGFMEMLTPSTLPTSWERVSGAARPQAGQLHVSDHRAADPRCVRIIGGPSTANVQVIDDEGRALRGVEAIEIMPLLPGGAGYVQVRLTMQAQLSLGVPVHSVFEAPSAGRPGRRRIVLEER